MEQQVKLSNLLIIRVYIPENFEVVIQIPKLTIINTKLTVWLRMN